MGTIRPQIVLFGDSLTEWSFQVDQAGWGASLANAYARKADVVLRGFCGYNSRFARVILDKIFPIPSSNPPLLVTVFFGANDAADPISTHELLHVPVEEYKENMHQIVAHLKKQSSSTQIILITPPPIYGPKLLEYAPIMFGDTTGIPTRRNELTKLYADACMKVAQNENVPVINLWSILQDAPGWGEKYLSDGLHLSAQGNSRLFEELTKVLQEPALASTLKSEQMPWDFPWFTDLGENPVATLTSWCTSIQMK